MENNRGLFELFIDCEERYRQDAYSLLTGLELIRTLSETDGQEIDEMNTFQVSINSFVFSICRIKIRDSNEDTFQMNLTIIKNELISTQKDNNEFYLDFVFWENRLICILPVLKTLSNENVKEENLKSPIFSFLIPSLGIKYYNFAELWFDMNCIQPLSRNINGVVEIVSKINMAIGLYLNNVYGVNFMFLEEITTAKFVHEYIRQDIYYYSCYNFEQLIQSFTNTDGTSKISTGQLYISLPSAYTPGKLIDVEYYNAIYDEKFNLHKNDTALIIGYGTGIDLIHTARVCSTVYGVEINPFSVASARINYKMSGVTANANLLWEDVRNYRDIKPDSIHAPKITFNKVLWNIPYENMKEKRNPLLMHDFFDNYTVLSWFIPLLERSSLFQKELDVLLWKISSDPEHFDDIIKRSVFDYFSDDEKNICILSRK